MHTDVPCGICVEMLDAVLRYQGPVLLAEMGRQTGVGHGRNAERGIFCPTIDIVGNRLLSDFGIHAADGIGSAGQFNLLQALTLPLASSERRLPAVTGLTGATFPDAGPHRRLFIFAAGIKGL